MINHLWAYHLFIWPTNHQNHQNQGYSYFSWIAVAKKKRDNITSVFWNKGPIKSFWSKLIFWINVKSKVCSKSQISNSHLTCSPNSLVTPGVLEKSIIIDMTSMMAQTSVSNKRHWEVWINRWEMMEAVEWGKKEQKETNNKEEF